VFEVKHIYNVSEHARTDCRSERLRRPLSRSSVWLRGLTPGMSCDTEGTSQQRKSAVIGNRV